MAGSATKKFARLPRQFPNWVARLSKSVPLWRPKAGGCSKSPSLQPAMNSSHLAISANLGGALQSRHSARHTPIEATSPDRSERLGNRLRRLVLIGFGLCCLYATQLFAAPAVILAWDANPEADIAGYRLSYGTSTGSYPNVIDVGPNLEASVPNLVQGTIYYFAVTAVNTAGVQSHYSSEFPYFADVELPAPNGWTLIYADSEDFLGYRAAYAFDGDPRTFWHTTWRDTAAPPPHEIQINLGTSQPINGFRYLPRQDEWLSGSVGQFEFYVSPDGMNWGSPVATGTFPCNHDLKEVRFAATSGQYIRLRGLTDSNGGVYMSVAELELIQDSIPVVTNQRPESLPLTSSVAEDSALNLTLQGTDPDGNTLQFTVVSAPTKGFLSGTAPNLTYTPTANYNGVDSFTFLVSDGTLSSTPATVSIVVTAANDAPVAQAKSVTTAEDIALPITLGGTDVDGNPLTLTLLGSPANGTLSGTAPNLIYQPAANFSGSDAFAFRVNDGTVDSAPTTVQITVTPANDTPLAASKSVTVNEDGQLSIVLTATDPEADTLIFSIVSAPTHGTLAGTAPNFIYSPAPNFSGVDQLTFRANDGTVNSLSATISITVNPVNDAPVAQSKSVTTEEDSPLSITLAGTDADGNSLTYSVIGSPANGTLSGSVPNLTYQPAAGFSGSDAFTFRVKDGTVDSTLATVQITVIPVNDAPLAISQSVTVDEDSQLPVVLTGTDPEAGSLSFSVLAAPTHGTLAGTAPNFIYSPATNFSGVDQFTFRANDGTVNSLSATISIAVNQVNDVPVAQSKSVTTEEDSPLSITLAGTDADDNSLTYSVIGNPANGTLSGSSPNLTYQPAAGFVGSDEFSFQVNDGTINSVSAAVSITVSPKIPTLIANRLSRVGWSLKFADSEQSPKSSGTAAFDGNATTFWQTRNQSGSASLPHEIQINLGATQNINGFQYLPRQDLSTVGHIGNYEFYVSLDGITWGSPVASGTFASSMVEKLVIFTATSARFVRLKALSEVNGGTATCVAELNILREIITNQLPLASPLTLTTPMDTSLPMILSGSDPEGSPLTYSIISSPLYGTLSGTAPNFTYLPDSGFIGSDQFTFQSNDGAGSSAAATVSISVEAVVDTTGNTAPVFAASPIILTASEDVAFAGQLLATDADAGDVLSFQKTSGPGWLTVTDDGQLGGTPLGGDVGTDSFTVKVSDSSFATATATLNITVANTNDAPVFKLNTMVSPTGTEKEIYVGGTLDASATDPDAGDVISFSKVSGPAWLVIAKSGTLSGTPPSGSAGTNSFTIRATDMTGGFAEAGLTIKISANTLPLPWNLDRVGNGNLAGAATYGTGVFTIAGAGIISSTADSGTYGWQTLSGDGEIIARVSRLNDTGTGTRVGIMIRESLAANSRQIYLGVDGGGNYQWLRRLNTAGSIAKTTRPAVVGTKIWVRLVRSLDVVSAYQSTDGTTWTKIGKCSVILPKNCYIGLWTCSGDNQLLNNSQFSNVVVTPRSSLRRKQWQRLLRQ